MFNPTFWKRPTDKHGKETTPDFHPSAQPVNRVPIDLHQFRYPISESIGIVTISKFGLPIEEHKPRDQFTGTQFATYLTPRISQLFLDSIPHLLSVPFISIFPLTHPSKWGVRVYRMYIFGSC